MTMYTVLTVDTYCTGKRLLTFLFHNFSDLKIKLNGLIFYVLKQLPYMSVRVHL